MLWLDFFFFGFFMSLQVWELVMISDKVCFCGDVVMSLMTNKPYALFS